MGRLGFLRLHHRSRLPDFLIMLSSLLKFFGLLPDNSGTPAVVASARKHKIWRDDEISRYSPFMQGLPVISPDRLLQTQSALIERIRQTVVSSQDVFDHHYYPVIQRYSAYVHLLPASQSHHHRGRARGVAQALARSGALRPAVFGAGLAGYRLVTSQAPGNGTPLVAGHVSRGPVLRCR